LVFISEGCLPSWFRKEQNEPPQALETKASLTNEIDDPPELLDHSRPHEIDDDRHKGHHRPAHETNQVHEADDDDSESEELDMIYGTAAPIRIDHRLEEARKRHSKRKCKGKLCSVESKILRSLSFS
ncbi:hypothetical protein COOONC_21464, partial [Cooperia oncophora]